MSSPLVTCLCLTKDRPEWLAKAIDCFKRQSYSNRELLIVADATSDMEGVDCGDARIVLCGGLVGHKRNVGCQEARGGLIAILDDDDYSAPGRVHYQVVRLIETGRQLHGFRDMKFTDGANWWQYRGHHGFGVATSMVFAKELWRLRPFIDHGAIGQCGQDEEFWRTAQGRGLTVSDDDMDLMYATIHPGNTSKRNTRGNQFKPLPGYTWASA